MGAYRERNRNKLKHTITTAEHAGFCFGVKRAVDTACSLLQEAQKTGRKVYCLGSLIHNKAVTAELEQKGLLTIEQACEAEPGSLLLIRAHGEPPQTYEDLRKAGLTVIDCTCPVVLRLQKQIREASARSAVVIFGKIGHPEVLGLVGQTSGRAIVIESPDALTRIAEVTAYPFKATKKSGLPPAT